MFYEIQKTNHIILEPHELNAEVDATVRERAVQYFEENVVVPNGKIVTVYNVKRHGKGVVTTDFSGAVECMVSCKALVVQVDEDQVIDVLVTQVNKMGVFAMYGPVTVFVPAALMREFRYHATPPTFVNKVGSDVTIRPNTELRVRAVGVRHKGNGLYVIGTLEQDYLGVLWSAN